jgi:hypothetical protein
VWTLDVPLVTPADTPTREFSLTATTANTGFTETGNPGDGTTYTGMQRYEGEIVGPETFRGTSLLEPTGTGSGNDVGLFSGSIDGVGSGTLTIESTWRDDPTTGQYVGVALITAGTGDFTGASGFVRYNSPNAMQTGTVAMQLVLPDNG